MSKPNILLVDADERNRRILEVSLRKAGFMVSVATTGQEACDRLAHARPDLMITELALPDFDGIELVKRAAADGSLPVIMIVPPGAWESRAQAIAVGVAGLLERPVFIREIVVRIKMLLDRRRALAEGDSRHLVGDLADMAVVDLIQSLEIGQRSGLVHLDNAQSRRGAIYVRDGEVIDAELDTLQGASAIFRMLLWFEGSFRVELKTIRRKRRIDQSNEELLLEGMKRVDEWGRLQEQLPALDLVYEIDYEALADRLGEIPDEVNAIIRLFDGRRSLMGVVDDSEVGDLEALGVISKLFFEGLMVAVDGSQAEPVRRVITNPGPGKAGPGRAGLTSTPTQDMPTPQATDTAAEPEATPERDAAEQEAMLALSSSTVSIPASAEGDQTDRSDAFGAAAAAAAAGAGEEADLGLLEQPREAAQQDGSVENGEAGAVAEFGDERPATGRRTSRYDALHLDQPPGISTDRLEQIEQELVEQEITDAMPVPADFEDTGPDTTNDFDHRDEVTANSVVSRVDGLESTAKDEPAEQAVEESLSAEDIPEVSALPVKEDAKSFSASEAVWPVQDSDQTGSGESPADREEVGVDQTQVSPFEPPEYRTSLDPAAEESRLEESTATGSEPIQGASTTLAEQQSASPDEQPASPEEQPASPEEQPASPEEQPESPEEQPAPSPTAQQPAPEASQEPAGHAGAEHAASATATAAGSAEQEAPAKERNRSRRGKKGKRRRRKKDRATIGSMVTPLPEPESPPSTAQDFGLGSDEVQAVGASAAAPELAGAEAEIDEWLSGDEAAIPEKGDGDLPAEERGDVQKDGSHDAPKDRGDNASKGGGDIIPFPGGRESELEEVAEVGANLAGSEDPSAVSINVRDEAFFSSDYEPDPFSDESFSSFHEPGQRSRAKWVALSIILLGAVGLVTFAWYTANKRYLFAGDASLRVDRSKPAPRLPGAAGEKGPLPAKTAVDAGSHANVDAKVKKGPLTTVAKKAVDAGPVKTAKDAAPAAPAAPSVDTQYAKLILDAEALFKKRRRGQGYRLLRKALKLNPNGWQALDRLAWQAYNRGAATKGKKLASKALASNPKAPYANLVLGAVAHEKGQKAKAKAGYERFLQLCPKCPEVRDIRGALKSL